MISKGKACEKDIEADLKKLMKSSNCKLLKYYPGGEFVTTKNAVTLSKDAHFEIDLDAVEDRAIENSYFILYCSSIKTIYMAQDIRPKTYCQNH